MFNHLIGGLAQIIKDRGYNVETLAIEDIEFEDLHGTRVFNLYSTSLEDSVYLGTFTQEQGEFSEMSLCDETSAEIFKSVCPGIEDGIILSSGMYWPVMSYNGGECYKIINSREKYSESTTTTYYPSGLERLQERLKRRIEHLERLKKMNAPQILMRSTKDGIEEAIERINIIQNKSKILPEEIEEATGDVSLEEIEAIMTNMTNSKEKRQEALERGIGYGEK